MLQDDGNKNEIKELKSKFSELEKRLTLLEQVLDAKFSSVASMPAIAAARINEPDQRVHAAAATDSGFESKIGGYGLALLGSIVLLFGITFLHDYIISSVSALFAGIFGYLSATAIFLIARYLKKKVAHLTLMFNLVGHFLLYYVTLRLHYFDDAPLISNEAIAIILVGGVIIFELVLAFRKKSELSGVIAIIFALATGMISNSTHFTLPLAALVTIVSVFLFYRFGWKRVLIVSVFFVYLTFLLWFLLNPLSLQGEQKVVFHQYSHLYLFACAALFSLITLMHQKDESFRHLIISMVLFNGISFSAMLLLFVSMFFINDYTTVFLTISVYCMIFSIILRYASTWKFAPAFYAMYGFLALSISMYSFFKLPYTFLLLSLQSLYVVVIALWFRSQLLIIMNVILFILCILTYAFASDPVDLINFSFAFVAIASARIINWKKSLLDIKTELIRNIYLIITFFTVLYSLFKALPAQYVTLSWTIAAIVYFVLSLILKKVKYRWMALATMISAACYLVIVDLARISIVYRIIAFLFLAVISITISLYYNQKKKTENKEGTAEVGQTDEVADQPE